MFFNLKFKHSIIHTGLFCIFSCCFPTASYAQSVTEILTIRNEESINTKTLEYAPIIFNNQLVFTSTRPSSGSPMTRWRDEKKQFSDLHDFSLLEINGEGIVEIWLYLEL